MTKHIGIVAVSAEGAALCYRTICNEDAALLGSHAHPKSPCIPTHSRTTFPLLLQGNGRRLPQCFSPLLKSYARRALIC